MKKMFSKIICLILSLLMVFSVAGCGKNPSSSDDPNKKPPTPSDPKITTTIGKLIESTLLNFDEVTISGGMLYNDKYNDASMNMDYSAKFKNSEADVFVKAIAGVEEANDIFIRAYVRDNGIYLAQELKEKGSAPTAYDELGYMLMTMEGVDLTELLALNAGAEGLQDILDLAFTSEYELKNDKYTFDYSLDAANILSTIATVQDKSVKEYIDSVFSVLGSDITYDSIAAGIKSALKGDTKIGDIKALIDNVLEPLNDIYQSEEIQAVLAEALGETIYLLPEEINFETLAGLIDLVLTGAEEALTKEDFEYFNAYIEVLLPGITLPAISDNETMGSYITKIAETASEITLNDIYLIFKPELDAIFGGMVNISSLDTFINYILTIIPVMPVELFISSMELGETFAMLSAAAAAVELLEFTVTAVFNKEYVLESITLAAAVKQGLYDGYNDIEIMLDMAFDYSVEGDLDDTSELLYEEFPLDFYPEPDNDTPVVIYCDFREYYLDSAETDGILEDGLWFYFELPYYCQIYYVAIGEDDITDLIEAEYIDTEYKYGAVIFHITAEVAALFIESAENYGYVCFSMIVNDYNTDQPLAKYVFEFYA